MEKELFGVCPYYTVQRLLSGKWTLLILIYLSKKTMRFGELKRELPDMTQSTLTKQLRELEENGLVVRTVYNQIPPKVEYSLSDMGKQFELVISAVEKWGNQYIEFIKKKDSPS